MAPRITGGGRGRRKAGEGGNGRGIHTDDNLSPEEKAAKLAADRKAEEEAEAIQLMSVVSKAKAAIAIHEAKKAEAKEAADKVNDVFRAAKLQSKNFERGRIMELINDSKPQARRNVAEAEAIRYRFRKLMGLPVGLSDQEQDLESRLPDVEREGAFWFSAGYSAGMAGHDRDAPKDCVSAGHDNRFDEGWIAGQAVLGQKVAADMQARQDKAKANAPPPPEETAAQRKARERAEEAKIKEGLSGMAKVKGETATEPAPPLDDVQAAVKAAAPADDFTEATPEELAAQSPRQAVQAAREGEGEHEPEAV